MHEKIENSENWQRHKHQQWHEQIPKKLKLYKNLHIIIHIKGIEEFYVENRISSIR